MKDGVWEIVSDSETPLDPSQAEKFAARRDRALHGHDRPVC